MFPTYGDIISEHIDEKTNEYVKDKGKERIGYAFFIVPKDRWFTPCDSCQEKLDKLLRNAKDISFGAGNFDINLSYNPKDNWTFYLGFIHDRFIPCSDCKANIDEIVRKGDTFLFTRKINEQAVELDNRSDIDDDAWHEVERRPATPEELENLNKW